MAEGKILIIDDDPDITEAMAVVLGNKGYDVASAANSTEGMEQTVDGVVAPPLATNEARPALAGAPKRTIALIRTVTV